MSICLLFHIFLYPCFIHAFLLYIVTFMQGATDTLVEVSPHLSTMLHTSSAGPALAHKLLYLCLKHYSLASTTVTGIPMKEEQNASSSANYDVELFHHGESHARLLGDVLEFPHSSCLDPNDDLPPFRRCVRHDSGPKGGL